MGSQTTPPKSLNPQQRKLFRAVQITLGEKGSGLNDLLVVTLCELWQKWEDYKGEDSAQRYYVALASLKQMQALAKQMGLFEAESADCSPNMFEQFLKDRGVGSKN